MESLRKISDDAYRMLVSAWLVYEKERIVDATMLKMKIQPVGAASTVWMKPIVIEKDGCFTQLTV